MAIRNYTLGQFREFTKTLPDDTLVLAINPIIDTWEVEGMLDGANPFMYNKLMEVRNGMNPSDKQLQKPVIIISDMEEDDLIELFYDNIND